MKCLPFLLLIIFCSCSARKREKPAILEGKKIDVSSIYKKKGADLVEALYEELVNNSDSLKKLEEQIKELKAGIPDSLEAFRVYDEKSVRYYEAAEKIAGNIIDSALRQETLARIKKSRGNYRDSISQHIAIDSLVRKRAATIDNLHSLLKVTVTLPIIEEYQNTNRPDTLDAIHLMRRLDEIIARIDSLSRPLKSPPQKIKIPIE
jgi:hypothetical protein